MKRLVLPLVTILYACGAGPDSKTAAEEFTITDDPDTLAERLTITNETIELVDPDTGAGSLKLLPGLETFTAVQVAELLPPVLSTTTLQANDVAIDGLSTYIAYNVSGDAYGGAVDVLDITQITALKLLSSLSTSAIDYNGVAKDGNTLYTVGATNATAPAMLTKFTLTNGLFTGITGSSTNYTLPSFAGNDVRVTSTQVLATSGDTGGLTIFNKTTMAQSSYTALADVRSVDVMSDGSIMALSGQPGKATVLTTAGAVSRTMSLSGATIAQSKSTLQVGPKWSLAALGDGGMTVFCNATGAVIANIPQVSVSGLPASKTVTNAASSASGLVFSANGEAGVYVYSLKDVTTLGCGTGTLTPLGTLKFAAGFSANAVFYKNGLLYVASGTGGLKILTVVYVAIGSLSANL